MVGARRISFGHALIGVGLLVRRATTALSALLLVLVAFAALLVVAAPGGVYLEALDVIPLIDGLGAAGAPMRGLILVAMTWVAGRILAVSVAAAGWALFPAAHRALLARVSLRASPDS